jgi:hypothetical protein
MSMLAVIAAAVVWSALMFLFSEWLARRGRPDERLAGADDSPPWTVSDTADQPNVSSSSGRFIHANDADAVAPWQAVL